MGGARKRSLAGAALVFCLLAWWALAGGSRPFAGLTGGDIRSAAVYLSPPDVTLELDREQIEELAGLLRAAVTRRRDDSWRDYAGQGVTFTLELADGTRRTATAFNPFLIVDGAGYRAEYGPCEALNSFGNRLLQG